MLLGMLLIFVAVGSIVWITVGGTVRGVREM